VARRHGFRVALTSTPGGGVTATLDIDDAYLASGRPVVQQHAGNHDRRAVDRQTPGAPGRDAMLTAAAVHDVRARHAENAPRTTMYGSADGAAAIGTGPAAPAAPAPYEMDLVRRVGDRIGDWRPWNAFDVGNKSLAGDPSPEPPARATFEPGRPDDRHAAGPVIDPPTPTTYAGSSVAPPVDRPAPAPPTSQSGLRQRVPGRQLPGTPAPAASNAPPSSGEALVARDLVEAFEAGVRRAEEITVVLPAPAVPPPAMPPTRPAPAGARPLRRRTPGAPLDTGAMSRPHDSLISAADQDPGVVRGLVEQFESGVARALRDTSGGTDTEEGASG
jgi:hypothetical protein